jgi:hypothetical protein
MRLPRGSQEPQPIVSSSFQQRSFTPKAAASGIGRGWSPWVLTSRSSQFYTPFQVSHRGTRSRRGRGSWVRTRNSREFCVRGSCRSHHYPASIKHGAYLQSWLSARSLSFSGASNLCALGTYRQDYERLAVLLST